MKTASAKRPKAKAEGNGGSILLALGTPPDERTAEQRELLSRPKVQAEIKAARANPKFQGAQQRTLERIREALHTPRNFAPEERPMIRAVRDEYRRGGPRALEGLASVYRRSGAQAVVAAIAQRGHSPRTATNEHRRGSARGTRASSSSDDPGGESDSDDVAPCACGCGRPSRANSIYATKSCAVRSHRQREAERNLVRESTQLDPSATPAIEACQCGGLPDLDPEGDRVCALCGRFIDPSHLARPNGFDARLRDITFCMSHEWNGDTPTDLEHGEWIWLGPTARDPDAGSGNDGGYRTRLRRRPRTPKHRSFSNVTEASKWIGAALRGTPPVAADGVQRKESP